MKTNRTVHISYGNHPSQFGVLHLPEPAGPHPVIIAIHGGFWQARYGLEENDELANDLSHRGYAVWNIEYRRTGEDGGGWPGTFHDVVTAINYLRELETEYSLDLDRVLIVGHSAGGHLALWLASRENSNEADELSEPLHVHLSGIISLAGVTDLKRMWEIHTEKGITSPVAAFLGSKPTEVPDRYLSASPIELLPLKTKQVLIHGDSDRHVPVELSMEYYRRAIEHDTPIHLEVLTGVDHFQVINSSSAAWDVVVQAIESLVKDS